MKIGLLKLLELCGFPAGSPAKVVRHTHEKISDFVDSGIIETYQAYQSKPIFDGLDHIVSFYPASGSRAILYGVFKVCGRRSARDGYVPQNCDEAVEWQQKCDYFYVLERVSGFEELERRLVIDWGKAALAWHQQLRGNDKVVLELLAQGRQLPPFVDYLEFSLSFPQLRALFKNSEAHADWRSSLRAVAGVYLILAQPSGELYVGSAYGVEGIWGRWAQYAATGHGDNKLLMGLIKNSAEPYPEHLRFSILQILPKSFTRDEVIQREMLFKQKLGSRAHGLNAN